MFAILDPIKLIIENYPEGQIEEMSVPYNTENESLGSRKIKFGRELYIERDDFMIDPPNKYYRLFVGNEVRLMGAYFVKATRYETDKDGNVTTVYATYDPETKQDGRQIDRKVKGTIHYVEASSAKKVTIRLYENLIDEDKGKLNEDGSLNLNPNSLIVKDGFVEEELANAKPYDRFQFVRAGYFSVDPKDTKEVTPVFNRIVSMKSSFKLPNK